MQDPPRARFRWPTAALLTLCGLAGGAATLPAQVPQRDFAALDRRLDEQRLRAPLAFLSHDLLEGRGPGSRGDELSRLYLRTQLDGYGLEPGGTDGAWEQPVPILGITAEVTTALRVSNAAGDTLTFDAPVDYVAFAGNPAERTAWQDAPVVFVGYGIDAPEQDWDDYGDADLTGKVLLVMNNDPEDDPELFAGRRRLYYGRWSYKYEEAARRGAVGAIVIHTTPSAGYPFQVIQSGHGQERFWLPFTGEQPSLELRSWCSDDAARQIAAHGGHDLDALRAQAEERSFEPVELGVTASLATRNTRREIRSANVAGIVPGSDPELAAELVVVTAHFDHLGIGPPKRDDAIYNGALDNASGCAGVLNLARICADLEPRPRRSVMFLFVTAEESGLLGSQYFARNPTWPRRRIAANVNVDGINIWGATEELEMVGHGKNSLTGVAEAAAARRGRRIEPNGRPELGLFYRSDHFSFARIGVPAAYFKAGGDFVERRSAKRRVKASYTTVRYHQPNDEYDARWDLSGAVADMRLILECLVRVADADDAPTWAPGDEFASRR